jgi:hypothetical protein
VFEQLIVGDGMQEEDEGPLWNEIDFCRVVVVLAAEAAADALAIRVANDDDERVDE